MERRPLHRLARFLPALTEAERAEARRLGVTDEEYQATKLEATVAQVRVEAAAGEEPPPLDIVQEEAELARLRREPGFFKRRGEAPGLLTQAAHAPGTVAQGVLAIGLWLVQVAVLIIAKGEQVKAWPGILQVIVLGVFVGTAMWLAGRLWHWLGERGRDVLRTMVRFWPVTLAGLLLLLGLLRLATGR